MTTLEDLMLSVQIDQVCCVKYLGFRNTQPPLILSGPKGGWEVRDGWVHNEEPYRERPAMTYTFKLSRRLARLREISFLTALLVTVSCSGESLNDPSPPVAASDPTAVTITPDFATVPLNGSTQFEARPVSAGKFITSSRRNWFRRYKPAKVSVTPETSTLRIGATQAFNVSTANADGTTLKSSMTWSASGGHIDTTGRYTAGTHPGRFAVIVTIPSGLSDTAIVVVTETAPIPPPTTTVSAVVLTPQAAAVKAGGAVSFRADGRTDNGSTVAINADYSASGGSISPSGEYTAPSAAGAYKVIARDPGSGKADTAAVTVTVDLPVLAQVVLTPAAATIVAGGTKQFSATGRLTTGASVSIAPSYSATGGGITSSGMYSAGQSAGSFRVVATDTATGKADTASITVTSVVASISVSPSSSSLTTGQTKQLTAAVLDAAGAALSGQPIAWSSGNTATATVSSSGVVTAVAAGIVQITASTGGRNGQATITVAEPPPPPPTPSPPPSSVAGCENLPSPVRNVSVSTQGQLTNALANAVPGDQIELAPGTYHGTFTVGVNGSSMHPIALCGPRGAVIDGGYLSHRASYWIVQGFIIRGGLWGIYAEGANHNIFRGLEIYDIGQEGMQIFKFSSDNVIEGNTIHDTGKSNAEYGEAIYIGTAVTQWAAKTGGQPDKSDRNQILDNTLGPNVTSEHLDIKEGTSDGIVRGNTIDGHGMVQAQSWNDSWAEFKGNGWLIENNTASYSIKNGFDVFRLTGSWGTGNVLRGNVLDLHTSGIGFNVNVSGNTIACDNQVRNAGSFGNISCQ
jgi:Bacterial Ig-like domain (group 2)/Right handed beta helix region